MSKSYSPKEQIDNKSTRAFFVVLQLLILESVSVVLYQCDVSRSI